MGAAILRTVGLGDLAGRGWRTHFSFWSMVAIAFFLFADQQLAAPNLSRIGASFGLTDKEQYLWYLGAVVSIFFFLVGGVVSVSIGVASDQFDRKRLLFLTALLGEIPCLATAFTPSYPWFLFFRTLTGIGVGGVFPIIYSMLGDYFKSENRPTASAWVDLAMGAGLGTGQILAGELAHATLFGLDGWRITFLFVAIPSIPLILLYAVFGESPARGASERVLSSLDQKKAQELLAGEAAHKVTWKDIRIVFSTRTNLLAVLQGIPGMVPWGLLFVYMIDYYEKTKGFAVDQANLLTIAFASTGLFGGLLAGFGGGAIYKRNRRMLPLFCAVAIVCGSIPAFVLVNYTGHSILPMLLVAAIGGVITSPPGVNIRAIIINTNLPEHRGSAFAIYNLADKVGAGLGPFAVGILIQTLPQEIAYNAAVAFWFPCAFLWLLMMRTMPRDEDRVTATLLARAR